MGSQGWSLIDRRHEQTIDGTTERVQLRASYAIAYDDRLLNIQRADLSSVELVVIDEGRTTYSMKLTPEQLGAVSRLLRELARDVEQIEKAHEKGDDDAANG